MEVASGTKFDKIMVAFDGSQDSLKAIEAAGMIAEKFNSELIIVHVYSPVIWAPSWGPSFPVSNYAELAKIAKEGAQQTLLKGVGIAKGMGVKSEGKLLEEASTVQALVEFAEDQHVDLAVVGTRGMTGFKRLLVGSVSSGLVSHAKCPVMVVR